MWWEEPISDGLVLRSKIDGDVIESKSRYQNIKIVKTVPFGRQLILDGYLQSSEFDEHIYHESLVHPAMLLHRHPKIVLIAGGGELATVREVLKYKSVERVIMVDIDKKVVLMCREHLKFADNELYNDPRFELVIGDAREFIEGYKGEKFDIAIMDVVDSLAEGPAQSLYHRAV
jgi:spermidine synthase